MTKTLTKRPLNECLSCGTTWTPRGKHLSRQCPDPRCQSRNVRPFTPVSDAPSLLRSNDLYKEMGIHELNGCILGMEITRSSKSHHYHFALTSDYGILLQTEGEVWVPPSTHYTWECRENRLLLELQHIHDWFNQKLEDDQDALTDKLEVLKKEWEETQEAMLLEAQQRENLERERLANRPLWQKALNSLWDKVWEGVELALSVVLMVFLLPFHLFFQLF